MSSFRDQVAIVTGAARGIGLATAKLLRAGGATVAAVDKDAARLAEAVPEIGLPGEEAVDVNVDVTDARKVEGMVDDLVARFGRVDVLVNNAGMGFQAPTVDLAVEDWQRVIDFDLTAAFVCAQAAGRHMIAAGNGGVIVNISSIFGNLGIPLRAAYTTAKHGLHGLTKVLASEWAEHGIRCVSVDPGYISTELVEQAMARGAVSEDDIRRRAPIGRLGRPEEIAKVVAFVASDDASYMTGSNVMVDGGWLGYGGW